MSIRWAYAINQWKPQFDDFVRREQHERALKTISIAGMRSSCLMKTFMLAKAKVATSMLATPRLNRGERVSAG